MSLGFKAFAALASQCLAPVPLDLVLERAHGARARCTAKLLPQGHAQAGANLEYVERLVKFLLWQKGGWKLSLAGPREVADHLAKAYSPGGIRSFDARFSAGIYDKASFVVERVPAGALPLENETGLPLGGHLEGCRIGFDAGGSDRKVAAVMDGREVFSCEVAWDPKNQSDPLYHVQGVDDSIRRARERLPRLDAIGVSSAGIFVDNRTRVASLFRKVPPDLFDRHIRDIYPDLAAKWGGVPLQVANDGDVTALAGAMELKDHSVLGLAMGTSQAAGFVNAQSFISGWLNELAFTPVDLAGNAPLDTEWSGDRGTGVHYFSQEAVIRLAPRAGISLDAAALPAEKLKAVQDLLARGDPRPGPIFESIGVYLGYGLLLYAAFYNFKHVLILGRVTSGEGGQIILRKAREVLQAEDPALADRINIHLPDEASRRVGQAIAAASLPRI